MKTSSTRSGRGARGAALIYATVLSVAIAGMCLALLTVNLRTSKVRAQSQNAQRSFYAAEAGLSDAFMRLTEGVVAWPEDEPLLLGSSEAPVAFGTTAYWVEVNHLDAHSYSLTSTGIDGSARERLELVVSESPSGFFQYAAFGDIGVVVDSNSFVDSFDSSLGSYDSQVQGGHDYAKENGHVGSNGDLLLKANTKIHGDAHPGPGHIVDDSKPGALVTGSTDPADAELDMAPIDVPVLASAGTYLGGSSLVLGPGEVHYASITMKGHTKLTLVGPATVVVDKFLLRTNAELKFDTTGGPVALYATGDFVLQSNSSVTTPSESALGVTLFLSGDNITQTPGTQVQLSSNSQFVGAIYGPAIEVSLGSNFDIYGSIMCGSLDLSSNTGIHFDEALLYSGGGGGGGAGEFKPQLWRRLPPE
jgi:hypothetical protein